MSLGKSNFEYVSGRQAKVVAADPWSHRKPPDLAATGVRGGHGDSSHHQHISSHSSLERVDGDEEDNDDEEVDDIEEVEDVSKVSGVRSRFRRRHCRCGGGN